MEIGMKILHLYHDIMNLYGEYGNIRALTRMLDKNGIAYDLDCLSVTDKPCLTEYDFIYVGSGTESNQKYILNHLLSCKEELSRYIEADKLLLMTGNSFEILGERIIDAKGEEHKGLGLFSFMVEEQDKIRNTADAIFTLEGLEHPLVGFINKCSTIKGVNTPLFQVKMGLGNEGRGGTEGIHYRNFFGTHLTGPILIKNPGFLIYLTRLLCTSKGMTDSLNTSWLKEEMAGYEITLRELTKRLAAKE